MNVVNRYCVYEACIWDGTKEGAEEIADKFSDENWTITYTEAGPKFLGFASSRFLEIRNGKKEVVRYARPGQYVVKSPEGSV